MGSARIKEQDRDVGISEMDLLGQEAPESLHLSVLKPQIGHAASIYKACDLTVLPGGYTLADGFHAISPSAEAVIFGSLPCEQDSFHAAPMRFFE